MPAVDEIETPELTERDRRFCRQVRDLERKCEVMEAEHEVAKAAASVLKKRLDEAVALLRATIRRGPDAQQELQFAAQDWWSTPIEQALTLTERQQGILREAEIATVEDFEALRAGKIQGYPRGLLDLPRVGQATVDRWEDEILDWIGKQEQATQAAQAADDQGNDLGDDLEGGDA